MQTNFSDKNKSHLIRITETKKKRARRRLIGSMFLLLVALIVLLRVTNRITPIDVEPKPVTVEIKNTNPRVIASTPKVVASQVVPVNSSAPIASTPGKIASTPAKNASSAPVNILNDSDETESSIAQTMSLKPRLMAETVKAAMSPEDILNGQSDTGAKTRYYVQLLASVDKNKLIQMQDTLAAKGFKTIIQSVDTPNGIVYRLRIGPFADKDEAQSMLDNVNGTSSDE
jgi:DedD protein